MIECDETTTCMNAHLANLWKRVHELTHRYRYGGKRHRDLMQLKNQYKTIQAHQQLLETETWHSTCAKLGEIPGLQRLWGILRSMLGKKKGQPPLKVLLLQGNPVEVETKVIRTFFPHARDSPAPDLPERTITNLDPGLDAPFTLGELTAALLKSKARSAPGHDNVNWQDLRNLPLSAQQKLLDIINDTWEQGSVPDTLKLSLIYPIPKGNKDPTKPENLRPISLTSTICKLIERMIFARMQHYLEYVQPGLHPAQAGFRPNMGTHDCLWLLRRVINRKSRKLMPDYVLAIDMRKAFDNVRQEVILHELAQRYPSQRAYNWIRSFLHSRPIRLHGTAPGWTPCTFYLDRGVPQGSILGPMLFNLAMARVADALERDTTARFTIYADDITIWTEASDHLDEQQMQTELQAAVLSLEKTLDELGLQLSPAKTELISIDGKRVTNPRKQITLVLGSAPITSANGHIRILGAQIASCNSTHKWIQTLRKNWTPLLHAVRRMSNKYGGARQSSTATLARAVAVGRVLYGAPVYELSPKDLRDIEQLHRATLRTVTGLPKHTRMTLLHQLAPIPPIQTIITEACIRMQSRLDNSYQGKLTILWDQRRRCDTMPDVSGIISPWETPPHGSFTNRPMLRLAAEARRSRSCRHASSADIVNVYTDATARNDRVSMAWICDTDPRIQGQHSCALPQGTALHAELLAIWGALEDVQNTAFTDRDATLRHQYRILTDSFAAVQELSSSTTEDATANQIRKRLQMLQEFGIKVNILWTPGHTANDGGNAAAHAAAVQARGTDHTYATPHPDNPTLKTPYHLDPTETPLNRHITYMHFIRTSIKTASKQRIMEATPQTPVIKGLSRQQEVFINKVIANAAYTPHIISKWQPPPVSAAPPRCSHCLQQCRADLWHLIKYCPAFARGRDRIDDLQVTSLAALTAIIQTDDDAQKAVADHGKISGLYRAV
ncbi:uncharacterized protein LOC120844329 [Ixodes scapularis]|uniref:uncharacterized protein LOC120844329 n=1 Tax=Ixodes scapularis TaxID=6945 RepID=UPI001A9E5251|nr:uncharacterized protein LOC120844329 [Ixodes scapularis]